MPDYQASKVSIYFLLLRPPRGGGKMLCLGPQVVALNIFAHGTYLSIYTFSMEISTGSMINKGLHHVVRILLGTPIGGLQVVLGGYPRCPDNRHLGKCHCLHDLGSLTEQSISLLPL